MHVPGVCAVLTTQLQEGTSTPSSAAEVATSRRLPGTFEGFEEALLKQPLSAQHSTAQHSTAQQSAAQHSTAQHRQHSTAQHSTAQHSTAQHSTAQHSTAQHSTAIAKPHHNLKTHPEPGDHPVLRPPTHASSVGVFGLCATPTAQQQGKAWVQSVGGCFGGGGLEVDIIQKRLCMGIR